MQRVQQLAGHSSRRSLHAKSAQNAACMLEHSMQIWSAGVFMSKCPTCSILLSCRSSVLLIHCSNSLRPTK